MADWAGAVAAMRARFAGVFNAAPVAYQNEDPPQDPWPPAAPASPWIYFEVIQAQTTLRGVGLPGQQTWLPTGHIFIHTFVPKGSGLADHLALAGQAGDVFPRRDVLQRRAWREGRLLRPVRAGRRFIKR